MFPTGGVFGIAHNLSDATLDRVADLLGLPRGWGTTFTLRTKDGKTTNQWYRRKRNGHHDLLRPSAFKRLIREVPIIISVSNHNGENFTNFQSFAITDFDNAEHPENAKIPLEKYCKALESVGIDSEHYVTTESGMKGYHVWIFFDASLPSTTVERFQAKVFELCGFQKVEEQRWVYLPEGYDRGQPLKEQDHTIVETLTALGEGKMLKAIFSKHPKDFNRFELPYPLEKILSRQTGEQQTDEDFATAEVIIMKVQKCSADVALRVSETTTLPTEPTATNELIKELKQEPRVKFKTPLMSSEMEAKCLEMLNRIFAVPCLTKCFDVSISQHGVYYLRANLVTAFANMGYSREEIAYLFREQINDEGDNANVGELEKQVDYWYRKKYHCRCDYFQEVVSTKFCCDLPCGRRAPSQPEPEPHHIHLTRKLEFSPIYKKCEELIDSKLSPVVCPKTTRAGFTTALNIVAREKKKKILFLVPRTSISEQTFKDTICLASEKMGIIINGFVLSANQKACLKRMKEAIQYEKDHDKPLLMEIPVPREDCTKCQYQGSVVSPPPLTPLFESDPTQDACMLETYRAQRAVFDSGFTTYAKIYAILNTTSEDAKDMLADLETFDIIVFDEITQFVETTSFQMSVLRKYREHDGVRPPTYDYFAVLNHDLDLLMQTKGMNETIEKIHFYVNVFMERYRDTSEYQHTDAEHKKILNPMVVERRNELRLNMIVYLNCLYNYCIETDNPVKSIYDALALMSEEFWYAQKLQTMECESEINFLVPPKNKMVVDWVNKLGAQIIITDAVLPYQDLKEVFGPELKEMAIGDPQGTAETQLVITDSRNVAPTELFDDTPRLVEYLRAVVRLHGKEKFLIACPNHSTAKALLNMEEIKSMEIPTENVTWYRSNMTIGVACNHRVMITLSTPYAPKEAFDWAAIDIKGTISESERFWKVNARNTFFQTIGRAKDPSAVTLSVVYSYGVKQAVVNSLMKECQSPPRSIEMPVMKDISNAHTTMGEYWLRSGDCSLSSNEIKVMAYHNRELDPLEIMNYVDVSQEFVEVTIDKFERA